MIPIKKKHNSVKFPKGLFFIFTSWPTFFLITWVKYANHVKISDCLYFTSECDLTYLA